MRSRVWMQLFRDDFVPHARTTPLPMETDPRKLFQRLFGQGDTAEERKRISKQYSSVLDLVSKEAADLQRSLGAADKVVLGDYLDTVREIERRVEKMEARDLSKLNLPPAPAGPPADHDAHLNLMLDLIALAYQGNLTRVFSLMMAGEVSDLTYPVVGVSDAYHPISHYGADKTKQDKCIKIQTYYSTVMAKFLTKLKALPDGDGSMLDHTMIVWGSNMSNSDRHNHFPLADDDPWRSERKGQGRTTSEVSRSDAAVEPSAYRCSESGSRNAESRR